MENAKAKGQDPTAQATPGEEDTPCQPQRVPPQRNPRQASRSRHTSRREPSRRTTTRPWCVSRSPRPVSRSRRTSRPAPGDPTQPDPGAGTSASSLAEGEDARQSGIISSWSYLLLTCSHKGARYADADTQQDERTPAEPYQAAGPGSAASSRPQDQDTRQSGIISSWSLLSLMDTPQGACSEEEAPTVPSLPICLDHTSF